MALVPAILLPPGTISGLLLHELPVFRGLLWCHLLEAFFLLLNGENRWDQHSQPLCNPGPWFLAIHQVSDHVLQAFSDEVEPIHLQPFIRYDYETRIP